MVQTGADVFRVSAARKVICVLSPCQHWSPRLVLSHLQGRDGRLKIGDPGGPQVGTVDKTEDQPSAASADREHREECGPADDKDSAVRL